MLLGNLNFKASILSIVFLKSHNSVCVCLLLYYPFYFGLFGEPLWEPLTIYIWLWQSHRFFHEFPFDEYTWNSDLLSRNLFLLLYEIISTVWIVWLFSRISWTSLKCSHTLFWWQPNWSYPLILCNHVLLTAENIEHLIEFEIN